MEKIIHLVFEKIVRLFPSHTAIEEVGEKITYQRLNQFSNKLAHVLIGLGVKKDTIAAVLLPGGINLVASMMAIFKSGGTYLPMDWAFSQKRFAQIFEKTFHGTLIAEAGQLEEVKLLIEELKVNINSLILLGENNVIQVLQYEEGILKEKFIYEDPSFEDNPSLEMHPDDANYIFYTSGSTGEGKAIQGCHKGLFNYIQWVVKEFDINEHSRVAHLSQVTFDASLKDILMPLTAGGTLCFPSKSGRDNIFKLLDWLQKESIHIFQTVPSIFRLMIKSLKDLGERQYTFPALRHIMLDGEVLFAKDVINWRARVGNHVELVNLYGTTEATILSTFHRIKEVPENPAERLHVGKPIDNTHIIIVNENRLCRIGEIGDIYIKTPYVTKGYYQNQQMTDEIFVQNPLVTDKKDIVYKTGDLGRYLKDRLVEVLGRKDKQVKVNGIRVELNEIEQAVLAAKGIDEAIVIVHVQEEQQDLICYYTSAEMEPEQLKKHLANVLNQNIIPAYIIKLEKFPLNINGKIDKKALPLPDEIIDLCIGELPTGETEAKLAVIWKEILKMDQIGREVSFFKAGGQSIKAIQMVSRIFREFNVDLKISDIFKSPTIRELATLIEQASQSTYQIIPVEEQKASYELTHAQKRLWILTQMHGELSAYNIPFSYILNGNLDKNALEKSLKLVVSRHESLRTTISTFDGEPRQKVNSLEESGFALELKDLRGMYQREAIAERLATEEAGRPFDLSNGPLIRAKLLRVKDNSYIFLLTIHHIIFDGWSMGILLNEILIAYEAFKNEKNIILPPLRIQYKDYSSWQNKQLSGEALADHKKYWMDQFHNEIPVLELPSDFQRPALKTFQGEELSFVIGEPIFSLLKGLALKQEASLFMTLIASIKTLLYKYSGQEDIIIGSPVAGRDHIELENQIGLFVNTLALRTKFNEEEDFEALLGKVKDVTLGAFGHQLYPFDLLVEDLQLKRDLSRSPVFDVMVVMQNNDPDKIGKDIEGLDVIPAKSNARVSKFDITFSFAEFNNLLTVNVEYSTDLFTKSFIERLIQHYQNLLSSIAEHHNKPLRQLTFLSAAEQTQLLVEFNDTAREFPHDKLLHELIEEQAKFTPDHIAVTYGECSLTFQELNARANEVANFLIEDEQIKPGDLVGVLMDRSEKMVIALLGILKSGAAYVPVDPNYPQERIGYILQDSEARVIILEEQYLKYIDSRVPFLIIDQFEKGISENPEVKSKATDVAYIIYTSGSTGKPKGVEITHRNATALLSWAKEEFSADFEVVFATTSICFDLSVFEIFFPLATGKRIRILSSGLAIKDYLDKENKILINTVPTVIEELTKENADFSNVTVLNMAGEPIPTAVKKSLDYKRIEVRNLYGPSEDTTYSSCYRIGDDYEMIPIGKPISNTLFYILDKHLNLLPVGIPGEICISGEGIARGYLKREQLTLEKFIDNPFLPGKKLYKTGDLGRWLPDGNIDFLGRKDNQVKIRGFRIELGEIENAILKFESVEKALVVAKTNELEKYLVAYYTSNDRRALNQELKAILSKSLPAYMVPAYFVQLEAFPLTPNGKINRNALPDPDLNTATGLEYIAPSTLIQLKLTDIWKQVLGREIIGIRDNFFLIGGHSLKATQIISRISRELNIKIDLKTLFLNPTIESLAYHISEAEYSAYEEIKPIDKKESYPVSHAQRRLWVLDQFEGEQLAYLIPGAYILKGEVNLNALEKAFAALVKRHESLRTTFVSIEGQPHQKIHDQSFDKFKVEFIDLAAQEGLDATAKEELIKKIAFEERNTPFNLEKGPLFRVKVILVRDNESVLLFTLHHIIADGWSMEVMFNEFLVMYEETISNQPTSLLPLSIQYKDYAAWQNEQLSDAHLNLHKNYWINQFSGEIPVLNLATDYPRPSVKTYNGSSIRFTLDKEASLALQTISQKHGASIFMTLVALVKVLLYRYTNQNDIVLGLPAASREHHNLENQIGFYVNMLALRTRFDEHKGFDALLNVVKETTLEAYEHQVYPFDKLVDDLDLARDMSRSILYDVGFTWHGMVNYGKDVEMSFSVEEYPVEYQIAKADLWFHGNYAGDQAVLSIEYNTDLFRKETIERLIQHYKNIALAVITNSSIPLNKLDYLTREEKQRLIEGSYRAFPYPKDKTIPELFEVQVLKNPTATAIVYEGNTLTYEQLNQISNNLAHYLKNQYQIKPGDLIGVLLERSEHLVVAILSILKAGAAYLPLDPEYPQERLNYILNDARVKVLLTESSRAFDVTEYFKGELFALDVQLSGLEDASENLQVVNKSTDLAYVIYTSGSTGEPKGVMVEHHALVNLCTWHQATFHVNEASKATMYAGVGFDASVWEIWPYLLSGACLFPVNGKTRLDLGELTDFFNNHKITHTFLPTAVAEQLNDADLHLKEDLLILTGGDKLRKKGLGKLNLVNNYGPTESTVVATSVQIQDSMEEIIPIGKPIYNTRIYLLDESSNLVPEGVSGEICISGANLARGYLNKEALTREKFLADPFMPGQRIYKTGDLGRWLPDGNLEFLGRKDAQVKVRGYRIELGEIENILAKHPAIDKALVQLIEDSNAEKQLVAYFVSYEPLEVNDLREYLGKFLPQYMVPAYFVALDVFPITPNGKTDLKALPHPAESTATTEIIAPQSEIESLLLNIWRDVLGRKEISVMDNFFMIGGDSIKAIQISSRMHKLGYKVEVRDIFQHTSIRELSANVKKMEEYADQSEVIGSVPLMPIQKRYFTYSGADRDHYTQSVMLYSREGFDEAIIRVLFSRIQEQHDALRMTFREDENEVTQFNHGIDYPFHLEVVNLKDEPDEKQALNAKCTALQQSHEIANGPMMRLGLYKLTDGDRLLISIQHLVVDGVSWRILMEDIGMYAAYKASKEPSWPLKTHSFKTWADSLALYANSEAFLKEEKIYWSKLESNQVGAIVKDYQSSTNLLKDTANVSINLDKEATDLLLTKVNNAFNTEINDILLAGLGLAIKKVFGLTHAVIALEGHGRENIIENVDISRTVGWFTTIYPVILNMPHEDNLTRQIKEIKEQLHKVPNKGIGYGLLKYLTLEENKQDLEFKLNPQISFNYLGQFDQDVAKAELEIAEESAGAQMSFNRERDYELDITGLITDGQLQLSIIYNKKHFKPETIEALFTEYKDALSEIISFCSAQQEKELTPSDFSYNELSIEDLDKISAFFN